MTIVPPIKSQGIKTKLVEWIHQCSAEVAYDRWVEPFMGTGVVAFNIRPRTALLCDSNPHLIEFYKSIQSKKITKETARVFLIQEGENLLKSEGEHYYLVRERFNRQHNPLDFLFLSRSCFNGMMRFNRNGGFNVPFCKKPNRFAQSLITRICNQISTVSHVIDNGDFTFKHQDFQKTIEEVADADLVYCDPPYVGRHVDYFDSWSENNETDLRSYLGDSRFKYILSTWLKNSYRVNQHVFSTWRDCSIMTKQHFYFIGAKESNRNAMIEALLMNFQAAGAMPVSAFDKSAQEIEFRISSGKVEEKRRKQTCQLSLDI